MTFAHLPVNHAFARTPKVAPKSRALAMSGTQIADARELRMRGEMGVLETPLVGSSYEVRKLPGRGVAAVRSHKWHVAARQGPKARGDATNYVQRVEGTPSSYPSLFTS